MAAQTPKLVKHTLLTRFKDEITREQIDKHINDYSNLIDLIPPMKSFSWGTDVSIENLNQGFTHVFETTFQTLEDRSAYVAHPAHVKFGTQLFTTLEKVVVIDYVPRPEP
ncbi:protein Pop [Salix suchowensis]|nr:protein Pop [Salix suchowensis]